MKRVKNIYKFVYLLILLILFDIELTLKGFNKTFKNYVSRYYKIKKINWYELVNEKSVSEIEHLFWLLDVVCAWYPRKADCIHKTFLGYRIIRKKYGIPVDMVIGVRKYPFEAHAWLQCNNNNFFNDAEETSKYKIILRSNDILEGN